MTKYNRIFHVTDNSRPGPGYSLLRLQNDDTLPPMVPGQFVSVRVDGGRRTFLRRPFSIHDVDADNRTLDLLVQVVGEGSARIAALQPGDPVDMIFPLGNGFTTDVAPGSEVLLVGGGAGIAPLLFLGKVLRQRGIVPTFLLGGRSVGHLVRREAFEEVGQLCCTTEDGSAGQRGFVTQHSVLQERRFDFIFTCGPRPMMEAVAAYAHRTGCPCEVSLENTMACGIGACLCCVEDTRQGHQCVCTAGPVFNIEQLKWQI
ncbi:MAG: dihydroorotate dehydrogenase electron transfer subunit [Bacteroidales bacterium]|nr:dihydroorotate dehydrogenase electron transfer subunit [Bacteroidales bacterium]